MRIGVDVRCLTGPFTGIARYTRALLDEMTVLGHEWILYAHMPLAHPPARRNNIVMRCGPSLPGPLGRGSTSAAQAFGIFWAQTWLPLAARADRVDVLWSPSQRAPLWLPADIASVLTVHDMVWQHAPQTMRPAGRLFDALLMPPSVRSASAVIAVSKATASELEASIPSARGKTTVIYEAPFPRPPPQSSTLERLGLSPGYVLFIGTLEPRKNLARLIEAYAGLSKALRAVHPLVIAGGKGWGDIAPLELAEHHGIDNHVTVIDGPTDLEMSSLLSACSLLAMPSLHEGFGLPLVEAMSAGAPVLTSNTSSMPEVVGDAAVLVDSKDPGSIRAGLMLILTDELLRRRLSDCGRLRAAQFSWKIAANETLSVFAQVAHTAS